MYIIILSLLFISPKINLSTKLNFTSDYQRILTSYVDNYGRVKYKQLSENEISTLSQIITTMCLNSPKLNPNLFKTNDQKLAFWINLYNVIVLNEVATHYPVKSVQNIRNIWKKKHHLSGLRLSLDEIEHNYIRKFNEPRSHFAIICGAFSCPKLQRFIFNGDELNKQFEKIEADFYKNPVNFQIDDETGQVKVSELFFWYTEDFATKKITSKLTDKDRKSIILAYLMKKTPKNVRLNFKVGKTYDIVKMPWHWQLNEAKL